MNKRLTYTKYLLLGAMASLLNACYVQKDIEIPPIEKALAVSGLAEYGDVFVDTSTIGGTDLFVSTVRRIGVQRVDTLQQGSIRFTGPSGTVQLPQLPYKSTFGYSYEVQIPWKINEGYQMEVDFPGFPKANCEFQVPPQFEILDLAIEESVLVGSEWKTGFEITLQDPDLGRPNFLRLDLNAIYTDPNDGRQFANNIGWFFDDPLIQTKSGYISDKDFVDGKLTLRQEINLGFLPFEPSFWKDWAFEVRSINQETFDYLEELSLHTGAQGEELFGQPRPIRGNITGGEGFFGVIAVEQDTLPWPR